jgi:hypothetical protein
MYLMEKEHAIFPMDSMKVNGLMGKCMDQGNISGKTGKYSMVNTNSAKETGKESYSSKRTNT